jgi:hypothetical protein
MERMTAKKPPLNPLHKRGLSPPFVGEDGRRLFIIYKTIIIFIC